MDDSTPPSGPAIDRDGFRLRRSADAVRLETIGYHDEPLRLAATELGVIGLELVPLGDIPRDDRISTDVGDFRIARIDQGLRVEVLDYHAAPTMLRGEQLELIGVRIVPWQV